MGFDRTTNNFSGYGYHSRVSGPKTYIVLQTCGVGGFRIIILGMLINDECVFSNMFPGVDNDGIKSFKPMMSQVHPDYVKTLLDDHYFLVLETQSILAVGIRVGCGRLSQAVVQGL